jgi:TatA/E family protein of Tat protein translocase
MLLFFGPNKLPALGKSLGKALAGFKQGMKEGAEEADKGLPEDPKA